MTTILAAALTLALPVLAQAPSQPPATVKTFSLSQDWDDAVSWDPAPHTQKAYPNPSSNPWSELLIGDSRTYYKMPDIQAYFRFKLDIPPGSRVESARLVFHCSAGGQTKPKLILRAVDSAAVSFEGKPRELPLMPLSVPWEEDEHDWDWKTHEQYQTPDLKVLLEDYLDKHGPGGTFGLVVLNKPGNEDKFKGVSSYDDERQRAARLVVTYR